MDGAERWRIRGSETVGIELPTLEDMFAAFAMQAILATEKHGPPGGIPAAYGAARSMVREYTAEAAYGMARAMMRERAKGEAGDGDV